MGQHSKSGSQNTKHQEQDIDYSRLRRRRRGDDVAQQQKAQNTKDHAGVGAQGNIRQNTHYHQDR